MQDIFGMDSSDPTLKVFNLFIETARSVLKDADSFLHWEAGLSAGKFAILIVLASNG